MEKFKIILKRILLFLAGVVTTQVVAYLFDYIIYPVVTYNQGIVKGFFFLFLAALVLNYLLILAYDWAKKDFFGFEELKEMKEGKSFVSRVMIRIIKLGQIPAFIALSIYDPFLATLFRRKSAQFDGFKKSDYSNLILSTFIGCFVWSGVWGGILKVMGFV